MNREINIDNSVDHLSIDVTKIIKLVESIDRQVAYKIPRGDLNISFVSEVESAALHLRFFKDPSPTDVMTFPGDQEDFHAGDIAICPTIAKEASVRYRSSFAHEITLYLIHGCLHLAGLDDQSENDVLEMRLAESKLFSLLENNLWASAFSWK